MPLPALACAVLALLGFVSIAAGYAARRRRHDRPASTQSRARTIGLAAAGGAAVAALAAAALLLGATTSPQRSAAAGRPSADATLFARVPRAARARLSVAVLNGSGAAGAARRVATRLHALGFAPGRVANAVAPATRAQAVAYTRHRAHTAAIALAAYLGAQAPARAGPATRTAAHGADLVVTLGRRPPA